MPKGDGRTIRPEPKQADPFRHSAGHEAFRHAALSRAGYRCDWAEDGKRCKKAAPRHRLFANQLKERRDCGDPFDTNNGMRLCGSHHTIKTQRERARRFSHAAAKSIAQRGFKVTNEQSSRLDSFMASLRDVRRRSSANARIWRLVFQK